MELTQRDLLAKTLQAEAGNQGYNGMVAVGSVIMNRLGGGSDLGKVILQPGHFSAWNKETDYLEGEQGQDMSFTPSDKAYEVADALLSGNYEDPTGGATHYYNPQLADPNWGASAGGDWMTIGQHVFGKANKAGPKPIPNNGQMKKSLEAEIFGGASAMDGQPTGRNMNQPSAIQMQKMQQQQGSGGLMGFLRDPRTRETFASLDRSGMLGGVQQRAAADVERQQQGEDRNRTADWLASQPNGGLFAEAIRAGMPAAQAYDAYRKSLNGDYVVVGKTLVDRKTGKVVFQAPSTATITRKNPVTGEFEYISGIDPSQLDLKESESGAVIYSGRMRQAENDLRLVEREGTDFMQKIYSNAPFNLGNYMTSTEFKSYDQARKNFINAVLRRESGAAIAESEFDNANSQYFPQPGDPQEIIDQKRRNRELAITLMEAGAGEGAAYAQQEVLKMQRQINPLFGTDEYVAPEAPAQSEGGNTEVTFP